MQRLIILAVVAAVVVLVAAGLVFGRLPVVGSGSTGVVDYCPVLRQGTGVEHTTIPTFQVLPQLPPPEVKPGSRRLPWAPGCSEVRAPRNLPLLGGGLVVASLAENEAAFRRAFGCTEKAALGVSLHRQRAVIIPEPGTVLRVAEVSNDLVIEWSPAGPGVGSAAASQPPFAVVLIPASAKPVRFCRRDAPISPPAAIAP